MDLSFGASRSRFFHSLADSAQAGLSPLRSLEVMSADRAALPREAFKSLTQRLAAGRPFSETLRAYPEVFPGWQAEIVAVGETTGRLDAAFRGVAEALDEKRAFFMELAPGLAYPFLLLNIAPFLLNLSYLVLSGPAAYFPRVIAALLWFYVPAGLLGLALRQKLLPLRRLPGSAALLKLRFSFYLGAMLKAAVPLAKALESAQRASGAEPVGPQPQPGASVVEHLRRYGLFSDEELARVEVGETSGRVDESLAHLAEQLRRKWRMTLKSLTAVLPPLVYVVVALVIAARVIGMWGASFATLDRLP